MCCPAKLPSSRSLSRVPRRQLRKRSRFRRTSNASSMLYSDIASLRRIRRLTTEAQRHRGRVLKDEAPNPVLEHRRIEVEEQSRANAAEFQIGEHLRVMDR